MTAPPCEIAERLGNFRRIGVELRELFVGRLRLVAFVYGGEKIGEREVGFKRGDR